MNSSLGVDSTVVLEDIVAGNETVAGYCAFAVYEAGF
jgi:hypothetical protein